MQNADKQKLKRQIEQEAMQIVKLDGTDLAVSLLSTCNALLRMAEHVFSKDSNAGITEEVYANYLGFAVKVNNFYELHVNSDEIVEEQRQKNKELFSTLTAQREELRILKEQYKELEEERDSIADDISHTKETIADIPKEIVRLRDKYKDLEKILSELQSAETEYSPEKQKKLQGMIDELMPVVEENRVATEILTHRWESLKQQDTAYDKERHTLTTNLIELISSSMDDLRRYLRDHEEFLDTTENTADELAENLMKCQSRYEEYSNWYTSSKTPLEAMAAGLGYSENVDLRKALDVGQLPDIKKKFEDVRQNLQDIDFILARCVTAVQKDLQRVRRRAGQCKI